MNLEKSRSRYEKWQFEKLYSDDCDNNRIKCRNEKKIEAPSRGMIVNSVKRVTEKPPISPRNLHMAPIMRKKSAPEIRDLCYFMFEDEILLHDATFVINCSSKGLKV